MQNLVKNNYCEELLKTLGIFERNEVEIKLKEIEVIFKRKFLEDKDLVKKTLKQENF